MADRLRAAYADIEDVSVQCIPTYQEVTRDLAQSVSEAWRVCVQMGDFRNPELDKLRLDGAPNIYFPVLSLSALWPAAIAARPNDVPTEEYPRGIFPGVQYGDDIANYVIAKHLTKRQAFQMYIDVDFATTYRLGRLLDLNRAKLLNLGKVTGYPAWDLYEDKLKTTRLHHTSLHPANVVLDAMTEFLIDRIDLPAADRWRPEKESLNQGQTPIHPDIVEHFGLDWHDDKNTYFGRDDITFRSYMWKYITLDLVQKEPRIARDRKPFVRELSAEELRKKKSLEDADLRKEQLEAARIERARQHQARLEAAEAAKAERIRLAEATKAERIKQEEEAKAERERLRLEKAQREAAERVAAHERAKEERTAAHKARLDAEAAAKQARRAPLRHIKRALRQLVRIAGISPSRHS